MSAGAPPDATGLAKFAAVVSLGLLAAAVLVSTYVFLLADHPPAREVPEDDGASSITQVPPSWVREEPANALRFAQYRLPGAAGAADAELALSNYGGGEVERHVERWIGQFSHPDQPSGGLVLQRTSEPIANGEIHWLVVEGAYHGMSGVPSGNGDSDRAFIALVLQGGGGWIAKCVGPSATIERWTGELEGFVRSRL